MYFVSVTRLRLRSWRYLPPFLLQAYRSAKQAKSSEGSSAVAMLWESENTFWTRTVWSSEDAMKLFMLSGAHRQVMPRLLPWCDEAAVVHWTQELSQPPSWEQAHQRLQQGGRPSKVDRPTQAHRDHQIRPPRVRIPGELRFK